MIYVFGEWELNEERNVLRCAQKLVKLEPRVFSVLAYLLAHRDRIVSKQELLRNLWLDQFISDSVLERCIMTARKAIGDSGCTQHVIKTFHRRGYRFVAPVTEYPTALEAPSHTHAAVPHGTGQSQQSRAISFPSLRLSHGTESKQSECGPHFAVAVDQTSERRRITVLSCALAHARELAEELEPEVSHTLIERFFDRAAHHVQRYGGMMAQCMDGGFLALFGVVPPCEYHALRAVRTALDLHSCLNTDHVRRGLNMKKLAMRIGVHTGDIVGKRFGGDQWESYLAMGDTMQFAINLQVCTDPGSTAASEVTYRLVQDAVYGEVVGLVAIKAKAYSVPVYKIHWMYT
jgi:DNA-binding winged helix-turn-helix (wHTH) protein/class 3 adenylate cyclase